MDRYEEFLDAVLKLGEVRSVSTDSQDVSEEYYDVQARIRTKKQEEERLLQLLEDATGKLEDVLAVEKELARVRGEIEQIEGRLRVLNDLTAMTTVELFVDEIKDYVPEAGASYATRIRRAFDSSISVLIATGKSVLLALVVLAPWLVVFAALLFFPLLIVRWCWRGRGNPRR